MDKKKLWILFQLTAAPNEKNAFIKGVWDRTPGLPPTLVRNLRINRKAQKFSQLTTILPLQYYKRRGVFA
jgi:hypothetical protein